MTIPHPGPSDEPAGETAPKLRVIPLGGCGEIGMNMTAIEYDGEILIVDCGHMQPEDDMPGVDLVIPDTSYLEERREKIHGIVLTHGHEDHIGGLPYIIPKLQCPVFGTRLTLALAEAKLEEYKLGAVQDLREARCREPLRFGPFTVEWISVTHSIPDASALLIRTPMGIIVHSGDYKMDLSPVLGEPFDFHALTTVGEERALLLLADSTNVERSGRARSEAAVRPALERYFQEAEGSIILATFSSALHRIQICFDLAEQYGRKVFLSGLNMERNIRIARNLGFLKINEETLAPLKQYPQHPREKRIVLTTGSQGEPLSGLMRMSLDDHKQVQVEPGDTVLLSARIIPGNERAIGRMINHFFRRGANVVTERQDAIHASGHANADEMRMLLSLVRPRFVAPVHGEVRHQLEHKRLLHDAGVPEENVFILDNGSVLEFGPDQTARVLEEKISASRVLVDGVMEDVHEVVLRDRMHLAEDGLVLVLLTIDRKTAQLLAEPEIISRGFVYMEESEELIAELKGVVLEAFNETEKESREEWLVVREAVRRAVRRYTKKQMQRFPIILPVVTEI
ncbi:ribonuclease J [Candidatus Sumerlaeota bacterium]|nr:ribonuclease J [Candidatus Sumerlaeota bacterium]